jgi:two-component system sensor histidine kinase HydH
VTARTHSGSYKKIVEPFNSQNQNDSATGRVKGKLGDRPSFLRLVRWVAAGLLIALGVTLSAASLSGYYVVQGAQRTVVQGQGEALMQAIERSAAADEGALRGLVDSEALRGLRCVVLFDAELQPVTAAGTCLTPAKTWGELPLRQRSDELASVGDRTRMIFVPSVSSGSGSSAALLQPPYGIPPPPGSPWPALPNTNGGETPPSGPSFPGPPPQGFLPPIINPAQNGGAFHPRWPMFIEFVPQMAEELHRSAKRTLLSGAFATLALLIAAGIFWRLSLREERAYATKERQHQLASLGEMAAVLAHELRNPLAALKGHAQLLLEQLPTGSRPHDKAGRVVTEALRLEALSEDLLSFVRTTVIQPQDISPAELLGDCAASMGDPRIDIAADEAPPRWRVDPARIRQVLCNLLRNALEASPPSARVLAGARVEKKALLLFVRDFGNGIRESDLERIFEPFYTTRARGTGLGLPIARRLVELHGGSITASNAKDGGALFCIRLPKDSAGS